jgi:hypothetical protein
MLKKLFSVDEYFPAGDRADSLQTKFLTLFKILGIFLLAMMFLYAPLLTLIDHLLVSSFHFKSLHAQFATDRKEFIKKLGEVNAALYACLGAPLLEETVFRLPLSFKKTHIITGLSLAAFLFIGLIPGVKTFDRHIGIGFAYLFKILIAILVLLIAKSFIPTNIQWSKNKKMKLIIVSIFLFGLLHISNYSPIQWPIIGIYLFYIIPQLLSGWGMTYLRCKYGFIWGLGLHCLINISLTAFTLINPAPIKITKPVPRPAQHGKILSNSVQTDLYLYQGLIPVSSLLSSLKNCPVGPSGPIKAHFTNRAAASSTVPGPLW